MMLVLTSDKYNDSWLFRRAKFKGAIASKIFLSKSNVAKNSSSARAENRPIASGSHLSFNATNKVTSNLLAILYRSVNEYFA